MPANKKAAKTGDGIAQRARLELESKAGRKVVTGENYLPPSKTKSGLSLEPPTAGLPVCGAENERPRFRTPRRKNASVRISETGPWFWLRGKILIRFWLLLAI